MVDSVRRHPFLFALPIIFALLLAGLVSYVRAPVYTAEARLQVGRLDVSEPGALSGFADATQAIAGAYSRGVESAQVVEPVGRRVGLRPEQVQARLTATPVPQSAVIRVVAQDTTRARAVALANAGGEALIAYANELQTSNRESERLFETYQDSSLLYNRRRERVDGLERKLREERTATGERALARARSLEAAARLQSSAIRQAYLDSQTGSGTLNLLQPLTAAREPSSDRLSFVQLAAFAALLLGAALGAALATLRANRLVRRGMDH